MDEETKTNIKIRAKRFATTVAKDVLVVGTLVVTALVVTKGYQMTRGHFDPEWAERLNAEFDAEMAEITK